MGDEIDMLEEAYRELQSRITETRRACAEALNDLYAEANKLHLQILEVQIRRREERLKERA